MQISAKDARAFLKAHLPAAEEIIKNANKDGNAYLTRSESRQLGELKDTYDLYAQRGKSVSVRQFLSFYSAHLRVAAGTKDLSGDLADNFRTWQIQSSNQLPLSMAERADIIWDNISPWGPDEFGTARMIGTDDLPEDMQEYIDEVFGEVIQNDFIDFIDGIYAVPVSETDSRIVGYAILGYGENDTSSVAYVHMHVLAPDGRVITSEGDSNSM